MARWAAMSSACAGNPKLACELTLMSPAVEPDRILALGRRSPPVKVRHRARPRAHSDRKPQGAYEGSGQSLILRAGESRMELASRWRLHKDFSADAGPTAEQCEARANVLTRIINNHPNSEMISSFHGPTHVKSSSRG